MAVYKRYGTSNEVKMEADFVMTKEWICTLLDIGKDVFIYILDKEGNTVTTMLGEDSEFLPPGPGFYTIKTAEDSEKATSPAISGLETMWRSIKMNSGRFPLDIGALDSYVAGEIMKKLSYKTFARMTSTCTWFDDILKNRTFNISSPGVLHFEIAENGICNYMSKHVHPTAVISKKRVEEVEKIFKENIPQSDLSHLRSFILRGVKIFQPKRESFTTPRLEEIAKIAEAVIESKIRYDGTLHMMNCVVEELLEAVKVLRPKRAVLWMNPVYSKQRIDYGIEKLYNTESSHLPEELMLASKNFEYLLDRPFFKLIGQFPVFQAAVLDHVTSRSNDFLVEFLEAFGRGESLGKNEISMFIYPGDLNDFILPRRRLDDYVGWVGSETDKSKDCRRGKVVTIDGRRLLVLSYNLRRYMTTVFAAYTEDEEDLKKIDEKIANLIVNLDVRFRT